MIRVVIPRSRLERDMVLCVDAPFMGIYPMLVQPAKVDDEVAYSLLFDDGYLHPTEDMDVDEFCKTGRQRCLDAVEQE